MKRAIFLFCSVLFCCSVMVGCSNKEYVVRYAFFVPDVYEADAVYTRPDGDKYSYSFIKRQEAVGETEYSVRYVSERYEGNPDINNFDEYLVLWSPDDYRVFEWNSAGNRWQEISSYSLSHWEVDYSVKAELFPKDIVNKTDEYIEFAYGNKSTPDIIRLTNDRYNMCIYHKYYGVEDVFEVTRYVFDKSESPIPHFADLIL